MENAAVLNDEQLADVNAGMEPVSIVLASIGLGIALFSVGYNIGRDMAKNGW